MKMEKTFLKRALCLVLILVMALSTFSASQLFIIATGEQNQLTAKEELTNLYDEVKDITAETYTKDSFAAFDSARQKAQVALEGKYNLNAGGSWYYHHPQSLSFIPAQKFIEQYQNNPWKITEETSGGKTYTKLSLINEAYGFYHGKGWVSGSANGCWPMIFAQYTYNSPIEIDFSQDTIDLSIRYYDTKNLYETGRVMLNFEGIAAYSVEITNFNSIAIGGGTNNISVDLKNAVINNTALKNYLDANGNKAKLVSVAYCNLSVVMHGYGGTNSNPDPSVDVYGFSVSKTITDDYIEDALNELKTAYEGLVIDTNAIDLQTLVKLYDEYKAVNSNDYSITSYRKLQTALKTAKAVIDGQGVSYVEDTILKDGEWTFAGKNSTGELLNFRTVPAFKEYYSDFVNQFGLPFNITDKDGGANIVFNFETIGFYHSNPEAPYWGQPIIKYDLSSGPVEWDFNNNRVAVDVFFQHTTYMNLQLPASISLFFENIGTWIELSTIADTALAGYCSLTVDLKSYYDSLDASSVIKQYLDANDGKDKLVGIAFRFSDIEWGRETVAIDITKFALQSEIKASGALKQLQAAVDALEEQNTDDVNKKQELEKLYKEYSAIEQNDYSDASWNTFEKALENAKKMIDAAADTSYDTEALSSVDNWQYAGAYSGNYKTFYPLNTFKYVHNTDELPTSIKNEEGAHIISPVKFGFYGENSETYGWPKQRYDIGKNNTVLLDFNTDTVKIDVNFSKAPEMTEALSGDILLTFANIGKINITSMLDAEVKGHYNASVNLSDYYTAADTKTSAILDANNGLDELLYAEIIFDKEVTWDSSDTSLTIAVNNITATHNLSVDSALNMLKTAYAGLYVSNETNFIFDNLGRWYIKEPVANSDKMVLSSENPGIFDITDQRGNTDEANRYYRLGFLKKGVYELPEAIGTYKIQYSLMEPIKIDFSKDAINIDLHATYTNQQNQDTNFYVDMYFKGYSTPIRLSNLYSSNTGLSKGRVQITARLYEFMGSNWNNTFKDFVNKNGGIAELEKVELSATYTGINWAYGGEGILVRDFSIDKAKYPSAEDFTLRVMAFYDKDYVTTIADRYDIRELEKDYKYMKTAEKNKLSLDTVKKYNRLIEFINNGEKSAYLFADVFDDKENWITTGAANKNDLVNGLCPITNPLAYLEYTSENGRMTITPTGLSSELKAFWGGMYMGWLNMFYYPASPKAVSIKDSVIYYDVYSEVDFMIMLHFNESANGITVVSKGPGRYTGTLDVAAVVNALTDDELRGLGIYNNETVYITGIRLQHNNQTPADMSYGRVLDIRTLAISNSKNAYLDESNYHKTTYKRSNVSVSGSSVEIVADTSHETYNDVLDRLGKEVDVQKILIDVPKDNKQIAVWPFVLGGACFVGIGLVIFIIVLIKRKKERKA